MTRRDKESCVRQALQHLLERLEENFLLARVRAAGNDQRGLGSKPPGGAQGHEISSRNLPRRSIELEVPGNVASL